MKVKVKYIVAACSRRVVRQLTCALQIVIQQLRMIFLCGRENKFKF